MTVLGMTQKPAPPKIESITDAFKAVRLDGLSCVYRRAKKVFIVTKFGHGEFDADDWDLVNKLAKEEV